MPISEGSAARDAVGRAGAGVPEGEGALLHDLQRGAPPASAPPPPSRPASPLLRAPSGFPAQPRPSLGQEGGRLSPGERPGRLAPSRSSGLAGRSSPPGFGRCTTSARAHDSRGSPRAPRSRSRSHRGSFRGHPRRSTPRLLAPAPSLRLWAPSPCARHTHTRTHTIAQVADELVGELSREELLCSDEKNVRSASESPGGDAGGGGGKAWTAQGFESPAPRREARLRPPPASPNHPDPARPRAHVP